MVAAYIGEDIDYDGETAERLMNEIEKVINNGVDTFYGIHNTVWDRLCAESVYRLKKKYSHIKSFYIASHSRYSKSVLENTKNYCYVILNMV